MPFEFSVSLDRRRASAVLPSNSTSPYSRTTTLPHREPIAARLGRTSNRAAALAWPNGSRRRIARRGSRSTGVLRALIPRCAPLPPHSSGFVDRHCAPAFVSEPPFLSDNFWHERCGPQSAPIGDKEHHNASRQPRGGKQLVETGFRDGIPLGGITCDT